MLRLIIALISLLYVLNAEELNSTSLEGEGQIPVTNVAASVVVTHTKLFAHHRWNASMLDIDPPLIEPVHIDNITARNSLEVLNWGCLFNTHMPHHSVNKFHALEVINNSVEITRATAMKDPCFIPGTTFWVNEHMAVGHAMYDIMVMQALASPELRVDRIVLQRAPCMNADLCSGVGTWDGWYMGFYTAMIEAFRPGIPVFLR